MNEDTINRIIRLLACNYDSVRLVKATRHLHEFDRCQLLRLCKPETPVRDIRLLEWMLTHSPTGTEQSLLAESVQNIYKAN